MAESPAGRLLLLDTHIWIWVVELNQAKMSIRTTQEIERAGEGGFLRLSAISLWEAAMILARGRLRVSTDSRTWVSRASLVPGMQVVPLSPEIAVESTRLPGRPHKDPADQIIMATARFTGATLVTSDVSIIAYARSSGALAVLDARA